MKKSFVINVIKIIMVLKNIVFVGFFIGLVHFASAKTLDIGMENKQLCTYLDKSFYGDSFITHKEEVRATFKDILYNTKSDETATNRLSKILDMETKDIIVNLLDVYKGYVTNLEPYMQTCTHQIIEIDTIIEDLIPEMLLTLINENIEDLDKMFKQVGTFERLYNTINIYSNYLQLIKTKYKMK